MNKAHAINRLCLLASEVGGEVFEHQHAHDCFCGFGNDAGEHFRMSEEVISFIENATRIAIAQRKS